MGRGAAAGRVLPHGHSRKETQRDKIVSMFYCNIARVSDERPSGMGAGGSRMVARLMGRGPQFIKPNLSAWSMFDSS